MPYIKQERRDELATNEDAIPQDAGELNWLFTMLMEDYLRSHGECYQTYNDIIGAIEGAKMELYRRKVALYENKKIQENGDVYDNEYPKAVPKLELTRDDKDFLYAVLMKATLNTYDLDGSPIVTPTEGSNKKIEDVAKRLGIWNQAMAHLCGYDMNRGN